MAIFENWKNRSFGRKVRQLYLVVEMRLVRNLLSRWFFLNTVLISKMRRGGSTFYSSLSSELTESERFLRVLLRDLRGYMTKGVSSPEFALSV